MAIPVVLARAVLEPRTRAAAGRAEREFGPDLEGIRYSFQPDWDGFPSVFVSFLVLAEGERTRALAALMRQAGGFMEDAIGAERYGVRYYSSFKSREGGAAGEWE